MKRSRKLQHYFLGPQFKEQRFFGGSYCTTRAHRMARGLSVKHPMHFVLRSTKARGQKSFLRKENRIFIERLLKILAKRHGVQILNWANVGNHLHLLLRFHSRHSYKPFIRALSGGISMHIMKWRKNQPKPVSEGMKKEARFWEYRPYSRIVEGRKNFVTANNYIEVNILEGQGMNREQAKMTLELRRLADLQTLADTA